MTRGRAVVTTPDLSHKAPTLDLPSPFVPDRIAQFTLPGGADDNDKPMSFAFGLQETEGSIRYSVQYGNYLWIVRALCLGEREATIYGGEQAGECDGLVGIYTDTGPFANANFSYTWVSGSLSQTVHATLAGVIASLGGAWAETLVITDKTGKRRAISHSIECWSNVAQAWPNGIPKIRYRFRGSRVLNTTTGVVQYTTNPVWQGRFWALDPSGGRMRPARINEPSFQAAAAATPSTQYESHMLLSGSVRECRKMFGLLWDGWMVYAGGNQLTAIVDRSTAPVATYDDSHFASDQEIEAGPVADPDQMVNSVSIEYTDTTDPSGIWKTKTLTLRTAGLNAGTETEVPVTFKFPQLHDPAIVNLKLGYLLYTYQAYRIKGKWLANAGGPRLMGDVVTQAIPARGISDNFRVMVRDKQPNGTYAVELELIDARRWAGASATAPAKVGSTLSDPYVTPPTPPPVTLVQEGFNIRVTLGTLTPPYDWYGGQIITVQQSGGYAEYELGRLGSGDLLIKGVTMGATYTVRSKVFSFLFPLLTGLASTATITPAMAQTPDVINLHIVKNLTPIPPVVTAYWDAPQVTTQPLYGASFWSAANLGGFVAANVNNSITTVKAFDMNVAADSTLTFDSGAGNAKEFVSMRVISDLGGYGFPLIEYSDNGSSWAAVANSRFSMFNPPATTTAPFAVTNDFGWDRPGAHRYWRWRKGHSLALTNNFSEIQWLEVTGSPFPQIDHYNIFDLNGNPIASIPASERPTAANPWTLDPRMYTVTYTNSGGSSGGGLIVRAVTAPDSPPPTGLSSTGVSDQWINAYAAVSTGTGLANGLNSNIVIPASVITQNGLLDVSGPTAAFSIGGFTSGDLAKTVTLVNRTGQTMTIVNEDASSTAANRITTQTVANVLLASPGIAEFVYDVVAQRWQYSLGSVAPVDSPKFTGKTTFKGHLSTVGGGAPTVAPQGTGWGAGATAQVLGTSSDTSGSALVTTGTGPGNVGAVKVTFNTPTLSTPVLQICPYDSGTGIWDTRVTWHLTGLTTTDFTVQFDNNGTNFTAGLQYRFNWILIER